MYVKKIFYLVACCLVIGACSKKDPILPGDRTPVFATGEIVVKNKAIPDGMIAMQATGSTPPTSAFIQDADNIIWEIPTVGDKRRVFSGLPTTSRVNIERVPAYANGFVYAGLSTGELVKVNVRTRQLVWIADIFKESALTGGASLLDIVAPVQIVGNAVYVGGLGDAMCRVRDRDGHKVWCNPIGVGVPFVVAGEVVFVVATDGHLYAINASDGAIFWRTRVARQSAPVLSDDMIITVGRERFKATDGNKI
ncbi:MAG: PQQ-like beta-propeller repeat protein [Alphaproteobacteria bacterium]|nr:PQQ-like beta-propeller repeat protein [Alphaproteobacteria bacterium]MCL2889713.1 PQQ-like beta-propeller repeat protein [Alphaproteobacteria bacterium]